MVSVREVMLQAGLRWLRGAQALALTHSTLDPGSDAGCAPTGAFVNTCGSVGTWRCSTIRFSSLPFKMKPRTLVLKRFSNGSSGGKTNNAYKVFNPLILSKLTLKLASVGRVSLRPAACSDIKNLISSRKTKHKEVFWEIHLKRQAKANQEFLLQFWFVDRKMVALQYFFEVLSLQARCSSLLDVRGTVDSRTSHLSVI